MQRASPFSVERGVDGLLPNDFGENLYRPDALPAAQPTASKPEGKFD